MKPISTILVTTLILLTSFSVPKGQFQHKEGKPINDCEPFMVMEEGALFEITNYSPKGKVEGRTMHKVLAASEDGGNLSLEIEAKVFDKKDKEIFTSTYKAICEDGVFKIDMQSFMNMDQMQQAMANMEATIEGENILELPSNPKPGDKLPDGSITIKVGSGGVSVSSLSVDISNRKIESQEEVTTPAGTFDCLKLSYDTKTKIMFAKSEFKSVEFFCKGVGMVRSETYNGKGKLVGYSELTKLEK